MDQSMTGLTSQDERFLDDLIATRQEGFGLPGAFYGSDFVFRAELDRIWRTGWLFAGHACEIPSPGDYFTFALAGDSLIVVRDDHGEIRAHWNICRHRGTEICSEPQGKVGKFVCPYHQWVYGRDGALISCRGMNDDLDKGQYGLRSAHLRVASGLIFVSLADEPLEFDEAEAVIGAVAAPQGFDRAKAAKIVDYEVNANWKIVWENNRECYHCNINHPQYIRANFDHYNSDDIDARVKARIEQQVAASESKWAAAGLAVSHKQSGMTKFPGLDRNGWFAANRTPLVEGYVSETMDGQQKAPLMGDYTDADVGTVRIRTLPNMWNHSSCDHGVSTRLLPIDRVRTAVRVTWLVEQDAVEGRDYALDDLMPFWQLTSEQDWQLCEQAHRGITSSGYRPGPLSPYKEYNVDAFLQWYLKRLAGE
jgi:Rieske 2Fe-2S family protein